MEQIVCLPRRWTASALFARCIRRTATPAEAAAQADPFGDCFQTSDTLEEPRDLEIGSACYNQSISFFFLKLFFPSLNFEQNKMEKVQCSY